MVSYSKFGIAQLSTVKPLLVNIVRVEVEAENEQQDVYKYLLHLRYLMYAFLSS